MQNIRRVLHILDKTLSNSEANLPKRGMDILLELLARPWTLSFRSSLSILSSMNIKTQIISSLSLSLFLFFVMRYKYLFLLHAIQLYMINDIVSRLSECLGPSHCILFFVTMVGHSLVLQYSIFTILYGLFTYKYLLFTYNTVEGKARNVFAERESELEKSWAEKWDMFYWEVKRDKIISDEKWFFSLV